MAPKGVTPAMLAAGAKRRKPIPEGLHLLDPEDQSLLDTGAVHHHSSGYAYFTSGPHNRKTVHSVVMGGARKGFHIDHINGNKLDNRKQNLRFVTPGVNVINQKKLASNNTSGYRGVRKSNASKKNPWIAKTYHNGKHIHIGVFPTAEEAKAARKRVEVELWGEECPT